MQSDEPFDRDGPVPLPGDSWADAPTGARHRLTGTRRAWRYLWVLPVLALIAALPLVVPLLSGDDGGGGPQAGPTRPPAVTTADGWPSGPGLVVMTAPPGATVAPGGVGPGVPAGPGSPTAAPTSGAPATTAPGSGAPATTVALPLVLEAEAPGVRLRSAEIVELAGASGGRAVRYLRSSSGLVEFRSLPLPDAGYRVTISFAPRGEWEARVSGFQGSASVTFPAGSGCCSSVDVVLRLAPNAKLGIELTHGQGTLPLIDRIVISAA